jgi:N-acetylmuramoyl-L-alanine amidase
MLRLLTFFFILVTALHALSDTELLKRADGFIKTTNKTNQFRAYNDYKNLYLRALMNEDDNLRLKSLKGIIHSGQKLHIDVSQYSSELAKSKPQTSYKAPKQKDIVKSISDSKVKIAPSHKLKSVRWKDERLVLEFDKKLKNNQINYFTLCDSKEKSNKYVFDIHASMLTQSQNLQKQGIDSIKLAQYNTNTLRLVIEDSDRIAVQFKKDASKLIINLIPSKSNKISKTTVPNTKINSNSDRNKIIVIDPGHGGKDPGAVGYKNYREKVVVLQIAKELKKILKQRGYKIYMTRNKDKFVKLRDRTQYANRKNADLFISIHANAVGKSSANKAYGIESFFLDKSRSSRAKKVAAQENSADMSEMDFYGKESFLNTLNSHNIVAANKLAIDLQRGMLGSLRKEYDDVQGSGVKSAPFWVLVGAQMPAVLVEVGFITHPREAKRLVDSAYQKEIATGMANGVERYFLNN